MPRNPDPRDRVPSIAGKIQAISGWSKEEKALFLRVGALVDALIIAQRSLSNPNSDAGKRLSAAVPIPQNVIASGILDGLQATWTNVNYNQFVSYEVQWDISVTFPNPESRQVTVNRVEIRDDVAEDLYIRVRTLGRKGVASEWSSTLVVPLVADLYDVDQDSIGPENRTTVNPRPELLGKSLNASLGSNAFAGVGATVGPGPIKFTDLGNTSGSDPTPRNQITYRLEENDNIVENRTMNLPDRFDESTDSTSFYPFVDGFYFAPADTGPREYVNYPGAFIDFFDNHRFVFNPSLMDIKFLNYILTPDHEQTGTIVTASHFLIKS